MDNRTGKLSISEAARIIQAGGVVAFPTETVYGLGADAFNSNAVAKIFQVKERPSFDPLIVHISDFEQIHLLSSNIYPKFTDILATKFWPGPLTIVLPKTNRVPGIVTSGLDTVAIRMPSHPVANQLIKLCGTPVAAPSANKFGMLSPTTAGHVLKQLKGIDGVIDGGQSTVGVESTVISLSENGFTILRPGRISAEDLEKYVPQVKNVSVQMPKLLSPGLLKSHYSPSKPLYILGESSHPENINEAAIILFGDQPFGSKYKITRTLSSTCDLNEAAVNLFSILHELEESDAQFIVSQPVPETGVGIAIMDRLRKAAFKYKG